MASASASMNRARRTNEQAPKIETAGASRNKGDKSYLDRSCNFLQSQQLTKREGREAVCERASSRCAKLETAGKERRGEEKRGEESGCVYTIGTPRGRGEERRGGVGAIGTQRPPALPPARPTARSLPASLAPSPRLDIFIASSGAKLGTVHRLQHCATEVGCW